MQIRKASELEERDFELENIVGNLLIAEYQVDKLRSRLVDKISSPYSGAVMRDGSIFSFRHNNKWYRLSVRVEQESPEPPKDNST
jgi:hypothetical protein